MRAGVVFAAASVVVVVGATLLYALVIGPSPGYDASGRANAQEVVARYPGLDRVTVSGEVPPGDARLAVRALLYLQEIHFAAAGRYSSSPSALEYEVPRTLLDIAFADERGWAGSVTGSDGRRCGMFVGQVPESVRLAVVGPRGRSGTPTCQPE